MVGFTPLSIIELTISWILIAWIIITTVLALKKVTPIQDIQDVGLMRGIWKLEISLGLSLIGLAAFSSVTAFLFPKSLGISMVIVCLLVFLISYRAKKDLDNVPYIIMYQKKLKDWYEKRNSKP